MLGSNIEDVASMNTFLYHTRRVNVPPLTIPLERITIRNTLPERTMRTISLRLDAETDAALATLCDRLGTTQTAVVKQALELLVGTATPSPGALGRELGLVGIHASGERDNAEQHSSALRARLVSRRREDERQPTLSSRPARVAERAPRREKP